MDKTGGLTQDINKSMNSISTMVENLPEEFFESILASQGAAGRISGKRAKCLTRMAVKTLKICIAVKSVLGRRDVLVGLAVAVAGVGATMYWGH